MGKFTWALIGSVGLGTLALASGCGDDTKAAAPVTPSARGESCGRTADCKSGLVCVTNVCIDGAPPPTHTDGGTGSGGGPTLSPLGNEGESCTRRADCAPGLSCILQTCTTNAGNPTDVDGGGPASSLGVRGESCVSVRDCAEGLTCIPRSGGGGVCDVENYGFSPTGKTCGGECVAASDCCEVPPGTYINDPDLFTYTPVKSCADILALIGGDAATCKNTATLTAGQSAACFHYQTYCNCAAGTWACTANQCVYQAACEHSGATLQGCPAATRLGTVTGLSTCNATSHKCGQTGACDTQTTCDLQTVSDDPTDTCQAGECTCVSSKCYRSCNEDIDCPQSYSCDTTTKVCTYGAGCSTDAECAKRMGDVRSTCQSGTCTTPCSSDHDCSGSGLLSSFTGMVCGKKGVCESVGCNSDAECVTGTVKSFCIATSSNAAPMVRSAVSD